MRFNIDRMCKLAGVGTPSNASGVLRESKYEANEPIGDSFAEGSGHGLDEDVPSEFDEGKEEEEVDEGLPALAGRAAASAAGAYIGNRLSREGKEEDGKEGLDEMDHFDEDADDDQNEIVEVDEASLVKELRRMKRIVTEAKSKSKLIARKKKADLQEAQLKAIIDQEVKSVLKDLNLNSGWVYGNRRPQRSKKGYVNHGSFLKGIGFK